MFSTDLFGLARLAQGNWTAAYSGDCNDRSRPTPFICSAGSNVRFFTQNDSEIRAIFLNLFFVINTIIPLVGTYFIKNLNRYRIIRKRYLPSTDLAPWTSVIGVAYYWHETKKLPAGKLAYLMLIAGMLNLVTQNLISAFVDLRTYPGTCAFESGLLTNVPNQPGWARPTIPSSNIAMDAQNSSFENLKEKQHDLQIMPQLGIYTKVPSHGAFSSAFFARPEDTLGTWSCQTDNTTGDGRPSIVNGTHHTNNSLLSRLDS